MFFLCESHKNCVREFERIGAAPKGERRDEADTLGARDFERKVTTAVWSKNIQAVNINGVTHSHSLLLWTESILHIFKDFIFRMLLNRRRSTFMRPPFPQFQCCRCTRGRRAWSVLCMQYIFQTDRAYPEDAGPRRLHFPSPSTLKLGEGGRSGAWNRKMRFYARPKLDEKSASELLVKSRCRGLILSRAANVL